MENRMKITLRPEVPGYMRDNICDYLRRGGSDLEEVGLDDHHLLFVPKKGFDGVVDVGAACIVMRRDKEFVSMCEEWVGVEIEDDGTVYETDFLAPVRRVN